MSDYLILTQDNSSATEDGKRKASGPSARFTPLRSHVIRVPGLRQEVRSELSFSRLVPMPPRLQG